MSEKKGLKFAWMKDSNIINPKIAKEVTSIPKKGAEVETYPADEINKQPETKIEEIPIKRINTSQIKQDSLHRGLKLPGFKRATIIIDEQRLSDIKSLSYWTNLHTYEIINDILNEFFKDKTVKPIPVKSSKEKIQEALNNNNKQ